MIIFLICLFLLVIYVFCNYFLAYVEGDSMLPTFEEGNIVLCRRYINKKNIRKYKNKILIFEHPLKKNRWLIKRLTNVSYMNYGWFVGDNMNFSCDSRQFGYVEPKHIKGIVVKTIKK